MIPQAQVPEPITDELEKELAEKKRLQNKLKRDKEKQKKLEKQQKQEEEDEKNRFLNLSDREKVELTYLILKNLLQVIKFTTRQFCQVLFYNWNRNQITQLFSHVCFFCIQRALAAEKRIIGECKRTGDVKPVLMRCFDCGIDITGKVPFEYNLNKFCSPKCLAAHRRKFPTPLSV